MSRRLMLTEPAAPQELVAEIRRLARPLQSADDLDPLFAKIQDARIVLLGEASHGTHEYYTWRATITQRLVEEAGFSFIAVEGDWPDCYQVNRFIKEYPGAADDAESALSTYHRWPIWMWANEEVRDLIAWLREWNRSQAEADKVGFYGLDVYSLWDSLYEVMHYLQQHEPGSLAAARDAIRCFEPFGEDAQEYARYTALVPHACKSEVITLLKEVREAIKSHDGDGRDGKFVAEQNALVVRNAEAYYRAMIRSDHASWNVRDRHMAVTLDRLLAHHGESAKAIVWEHNTHIGDARYTDMAGAGMVNLGQLTREAYGEQSVALVGFGSHRGEVIAGKYWDAPWEKMSVPPARPGSWEDLLHRASPQDKMFLFGENCSPQFMAPRGHRAIGVVYHPEREQYGNYVPTELSRRYDAFLYIDQTTALRPLLAAERGISEEMPETFPSGV